MTARNYRLSSDVSSNLTDVCLHQVEKLQQSLLSLESEAELLRTQLHAVNQEKLGHAQEVSDLQRELQSAQSKVLRNTGLRLLL